MMKNSHSNHNQVLHTTRATPRRPHPRRGGRRTSAHKKVKSGLSKHLAASICPCPASQPLAPLAPATHHLRHRRNNKMLSNCSNKLTPNAQFTLHINYTKLKNLQNQNYSSFSFLPTVTSVPQNFKTFHFLQSNYTNI